MLMAPIRAGLPSAEEAAQDIDQILHAVRTHLNMDVGFLSEFTEGQRVFRNVDSTPGKECIEVGAGNPLEDSYCYWIANGTLPKLIRDPADHPFTERFPATKDLPVGAHLSIPIILRDGATYGTFCCFSYEVDRTLTDRDLSTMEAFAEVASSRIQQMVDRGREHRENSLRIETMMAGSQLDIVYQPAVRLHDGKVEFVEALSRFRPQPYRSPDIWFAEATDVGLGMELELLAVSMAIEDMPRLQAGSSLSFNVSPETALSREMQRILKGAPLDRLIIEITEHDAVENYEALGVALEPLRKRGLRLAVDDTGAGYSSFRHILHMRPDLIKLDVSLSRGIETDPARKALATALIGFARDIGSKLVAEGVESADELNILRELGINIVQGYLLARPGPPEAKPGWAAQLLH